MQKLVQLSCLLLSLVLSSFSGAGEDMPRGSVVARVAVSSGGVARVLETQSSLPQRVLDQLRPTFEQRAREEQAETGPGEPVEYRIVIDWSVVKSAGGEQLELGFREADYRAVAKVYPDLPCDQWAMAEQAGIVIGFTVSAQGTAEDIEWLSGRRGARPVFEAYRQALKRWTFEPRYVRGVARATATSMPLETPPADAGDVPEKG